MEIEGTLSSVFEKHVTAEFVSKDADQALKTMADDPYVNLVPLMVGGQGRTGVRDFYANHFVVQLPSDIEIVPVSRTIGQGQLVDEMIIRFTHTLRMDWLLPGIPPTGDAWDCHLSRSSSSKATRSRTSTSTGTKPRCSFSSTSWIERCPCAVARSRHRCSVPRNR